MTNNESKCNKCNKPLKPTWQPHIYEACDCISDKPTSPEDWEAAIDGRFAKYHSVRDEDDDYMLVDLKADVIALIRDLLQKQHGK